MYYDHLKRRVGAAMRQQRLKNEALAAVRDIDIYQHIAKVYHPLHEDIKDGTHTVFNLPGGRGSAKSSFVGFEIVNGIMEDETGNSNAIIFRNVGATLRDSVFSQIAWCIEALGVSHLWKPRVSPMQYTYLPTGAQILFRGLDDANKLKSIKPTKGMFKYIWFEEFCELAGPNFVRSVMQSVQRGGDGFVVFRSFNPPISTANWANVFIQEPDARAITLHTDYTMIPPEWLGDAFLYEAERLREINPKAYEHEYMGVPTGSGGEVFPNLEIRAITDAEADGMEYIYQGCDFGFAVDPCVFIRAAYDRAKDTVYLLDEIYERQCSNKRLADLIKAKGYHRTENGHFDVFANAFILDKPLIVCDSAEPKSIADLRNEELHVIGCKKFPGCVEYRVKWLQHRKIVIDPARTPNAHREFVNYQYATDRDGVFLSILPDKNNHTIDALAYALDRVIYVKGNKGVSA